MVAGLNEITDGSVVLGDREINGAGPDFNAPFGGYKMSGNGREWGIEGFEEFLETKAIMGFDAA